MIRNLSVNSSGPLRTPRLGALILALCAAGALAAEPDGKAATARRPVERVWVAVDRDKFGEGWRQTISLDSTGEAYDVWVQGGWLRAKRYDQDGAVDWQIVLGRLAGTEPPSISRVGDFQFELSYRDGRYFIRETGPFLRSVREKKDDQGLFVRATVLGDNPKARGWGRAQRDQWSMLSAWERDDWFFVGLGPDQEQFEVLVRLNPMKKTDAGYGVTTMAGGFLREFHGDTWLFDDGELLVAQRTLRSNYEAELAREKIAKNLLGGAPPGIDATAWLNTKDGLSWERLRGKVVLLDFWGTWCGPCVEKLPKVQQFADRYAARDVVVIGIHSAQDGDTCREFVEKRGFTFPIAIDSGQTAKTFAIESWPSMFLIDKTGKVAIGYSNDLPDDEVVEKLLTN